MGKCLNNGKTNRPGENTEKDLTRSEHNIYKSTTSVVTLYFSAFLVHFSDPIKITLKMTKAGGFTMFSDFISD